MKLVYRKNIGCSATATPLNPNAAEFLPSYVTKCKTIRDALKYHRTVTDIDLSVQHYNFHQIGDSGCEELAGFLTKCPVLNSINLSLNNIGTKGCRALAEVIPKCPSLTNIDLSHNNIGGKGCKVLAATFPHCPRLSSINLSRNDIGTEGFIVLAAALPLCPNLANIKMGCYNTSNADGWKALAESLTKCRNITHIGLGGNGIEIQGCRALATVLTKNHNIISIDLSAFYAEIGPQGCKDIARAIKFCQSLTSINLNFNSIGDEGCKALAGAITKCRNISKINLRDNRIGIEGCNALTTSLRQCRTITSVDLSGNNIGYGIELKAVTDSILAENRDYVSRWPRRRSLIMLSASCCKFSRVLDDNCSYKEYEEGSSTLSAVEQGICCVSSEFKAMVLQVLCDQNLVKYISQFL